MSFIHLFRLCLVGKNFLIFILTVRLYNSLIILIRKQNGLANTFNTENVKHPIKQHVFQLIVNSHKKNVIITIAPLRKKLQKFLTSSFAGERLKVSQFCKLDTLIPKSWHTWSQIFQINRML